MSSVPRVLVIDDELRICESIKALLQMQHYVVDYITRPAEIDAVLRDKSYDLFLLDLCMPGISGFDVLERILRQEADAHVIMITGYASIETAVTALKKGACDYLKKPFEPDDLIRTVKNVFTQKRLKDENRVINQKLENSERRYRFLVQNSPDIIYMLDNAGRFTFVNEAAQRLLGYTQEDLIGKSYESIVARPDREKARWLLNERRTGERACSGEEIRLRLNRKAPQYRECEVRHLTIELKATGVYVNSSSASAKKFVGTYGVARDISYRRHLESQLRHARKMESIGTLAGGIAHDFNNILMGIQGCASLMLYDIKDRSDQNYVRLTNIEQYVQSGAELTRQLLGFARAGKYQVRPTNLNRLIERSASMFGRTRKEIDIRWHLQKDLWSAKVDSGQIEQVLINLYVNAWQAMPGGGLLDITTENVSLDQTQARKVGLKPGNFVMMSVSDSGIGMDENTCRRVFDPFFTTKDKGRGTGLGLASAYGIIQNHGGSIHVTSQPGQGSRFVIYLPATRQDPVEIKIEHHEIQTGSGMVLLVDDEQSIVDSTREMLENMGYSVVTANSGNTALQKLEQYGDQIDLMMLDMIMPGMGGNETFIKVKQIKPDLKVLLCSGYSINGQAREILDCGCDDFIQKPYNLDQLSQKVRQLLCERKTA